jgi:hypothetical protein
MRSASRRRGIFQPRLQPMKLRRGGARRYRDVAPDPAALVLCLALLTSGCASGTSTLFDSLDSNNDNTLSRDEWNRGFDKIDTSGDGVITSQEFNTAAGGGSPAGGGGGGMGGGGMGGGGHGGGGY